MEKFKRRGSRELCVQMTEWLSEAIREHPELARSIDPRAGGDAEKLVRIRIVEEQLGL